MSPEVGSRELVIRPPTVWDTRAPLAYFLRAHKQENWLYYTLLLSIERVARDLKETDPDLPALSFFHVAETDRSYKGLLHSSPTNPDRTHVVPTVRDLRTLSAKGVPAITEYAISSYCGAFEHFVQCWALNYLLYLLETGPGWLDCHAKLAARFAKFASGNLPSLPAIEGAIPIVKSCLSATPHTTTDPRTRKPLTKPLTANLNAYSTVRFWREWRNLLVHESGTITSTFYADHAPFWLDFRSVFPHIPPLRPGHQLHLNQATFIAFTSAHHCAAKALRADLVTASNGHRGHSLAPNPPTADGKIPPDLVPERLPPLLLPCDHAASYEYTLDPSYVAQTRWAAP